MLNFHIKEGLNLYIYHVYQVWVEHKVLLIV